MHLSSHVFDNCEPPLRGSALPYSLASGSDPDDGPAKPASFARAAGGQDDLPYMVELWDEAKTVVEQVLAVTANGSIGFAAYYGAIREYPDRYITLRHRNRTVARSKTPQN